MATFVLIHGAGDVGWYWHLVEAELRERGHDVVAPDLPCDDDSAGLPEYADSVVEAIGDRSDLVVVAQSAGGFTALLVCDQVAVKLLVLVAPMIPAPGEAPADYFVNTRYDEEVRESYDDPIELFYQDVPPDLASEALRRDVSSPRRGWGTHRRSRHGRTSPPASCSAARTGCSRPSSFGGSLGSAWASHPMRSRADTPRLSATRRSWPSASTRTPPTRA